MKNFKNFYDINYKYQDLFESSFIKLYEKNYFGTIDKDIAKTRLNEWFLKFVILLENKMEEELEVALCSDNKENRLWFEAITGHNIKNETNKVIKQIVETYCRSI